MIKTVPGYSRLFAAFLLLTGFSLPAAAAPGEGDFARISDLSGTLQVKGGYDEDWVEMGTNVPVGAGDSLWLEEGGLAEVEFPGGTRVRLQGESKLDLYEFTVYPASFFASLEAVEGRLYIRTGGRDASGNMDPVEIKIPSARISIRPESLVRLDIESGRTRVRVREGNVQIDPFGPGDPTPIFLGRMEQIRIEPNAEPGFPGYFRTISEDGLERYNRFRDDRFLNEEPDDRLEQALVGQDELERHGQWVLIGGVQFWRPYVSVTWRPYSVGSWAWYHGAGWMWISGDPFGYVTFHYGRWHHDPYYGWVWHPGYVFAPAYVHWVAVGPYYAWAPLGPFGYPITIGYFHFSIYSGFGIDLNIWSYAHIDYFAGIRHHHHHPREHIHFRVPDRRIFTEHQGRVVKAVRVGGQAASPDRNRQFTRPEGDTWRPYPNNPRGEREDTRLFRGTDPQRKKDFPSEKRTSRSVQRPGTTGKGTPSEGYSKPGRKLYGEPPREIRKAPLPEKGKAVSAWKGQQREGEVKQYRKSPKTKGEDPKKGPALEKTRKGSGDRGLTGGTPFKPGGWGKNK